MILLTQLFLLAAHAASPTYPYWHVYVDADGRTRQTQCAFENMELKAVNAGVTPQWLERLDGVVEKISVTTQPVGWVGDWHENPGPQWIIPLRGRWFVETHDGKRIEMGPGDVSLGEDQGSRAQNGKRGHLSGTVGTEPATLMIVSLKAPLKGAARTNQPCHQR